MAKNTNKKAADEKAAAEKETTEVMEETPDQAGTEPAASEPEQTEPEQKDPGGADGAGEGVGPAKNVLTYTGHAYINVRTYPNTGHIIGRVRSGEHVELLERLTNGWVKVRTAEGDVGYCVDKHFAQPAE